MLVVASVQLFFSLWKGGYFAEQWYWGVVAVAAALVGAAFVPGYLSSPLVGRKQWALAGTLLLLTVVVAASILWSISPVLSVLEASRTAMYTGVFVLLMPAAARWGSLVIDATIFGALLPPALYGLLQKILPAFTEYTGFAPLGVETDPKASSTIGYHATFGMMCAMGALLVVARVGSFRSIRSTPLRALYSATGVLFLVALYFSFSRGALLALAVGAVVLLLLAKHRLEVLGNLAVTILPALWVVSQAREYPGLVTRSLRWDPVSLEMRAMDGLAEAMARDGLALASLLLKGLLLALAAQVLLTVLARAFVKYTTQRAHAARRARAVLRIVGTVAAAGVVVWGLFLGWSVFQRAGDFDELRSRVMADVSQEEWEASTRDQTHRLSSLSVASRMALWKIAWENWREHPFTGTGGDTYQVVYQEKAPEGSRDVLHPHSMWMSLLSDTGIFAFMAFAAFCVGCLALASYNAFCRTSSRRDRALLAGSAAAVAAYLVSSSIDWNWYIPASTLPFFALASVVVASTVRFDGENG